ncbi:hypothetical protein C8F04DRAFT_1134622 [Mycena alexandri]|uniref:Uncharacterized protein n=1 Tax=Mycena alexandri TaxID=1745969 RepID=A0AAD6WW51_9AGAR|nr:hypothetical protein C8F04DRAFT_1134622 [Mycena alexandri]
MPPHSPPSFFPSNPMYAPTHAVPSLLPLIRLPRSLALLVCLSLLAPLPRARSLVVVCIISVFISTSHLPIHSHAPYLYVPTSRGELPLFKLLFSYLMLSL